MSDPTTPGGGPTPDPASAPPGWPPANPGYHSPSAVTPGSLPPGTPPGYGSGYPNQPGYGYPNPSGYGYGSPYDQMPREHPDGTVILVFGILGLVFCFLFGIAAWVKGNAALRQIDASPGRYTNRGTVQAGRICGMVSVAILVVGVLGYGLLALVLVAGTSTSG